MSVTTAELPTPALVIDLDVFDANVAEMQRLADEAGIELLPHAKTHRIIELGQRQIAAGAAGLTVATLDEAEAFADAGAPRILLAYPLVGESAVQRAVRLAERVVLTTAVDDLAAAGALGAAFAASGAQIEVLLLIDSGMGREGVAAESAPEIVRRLSRIEGVHVDGIMTHEGSVYGEGGPLAVAAASRAVAERMVALAAECRRNGTPLRTVSLGSSASVRHVLTVPGVTQVRPGIYALNDRGQVALGQVDATRCAARVLSTVVSHTASARGCIDAGSKTLSKDGVPACGQAAFPGFGELEGAEGWIIENLSEEHGWLRPAAGSSSPPLRVGQRVAVVPNHVCTAVAASGRAYLTRGDVVVDEVWTIPRKPLRDLMPDTRNTKGTPR